jgi:hypothetical protein
MFAVAFVIFLWGVAQYIRNSNSPDANKTGRDHMIYGIIGMAIMVSAFAIIKIVIGTFDIPAPDIINKY